MSLTELTLRVRGRSLDDFDVTFVGRRQQDPRCRVRALIDPAEGAGGLAVRLDDRHHYAVEVADGLARIIARVGPLRTIVATRPVPAGPVVLGIDVEEIHVPDDSRGGPDSLTLGVEAADGTFTALATLDGRYLSTEVAGGFTGRILGLYATSGTVHFDWFDYVPLA